jgi:hypothetical protein
MQVTRLALLLDAKSAVNQNTIEQTIYDERYPSLPANDPDWVTVKERRKTATSSEKKRNERTP